MLSDFQFDVSLVNSSNDDVGHSSDDASFCSSDFDSDQDHVGVECFNQHCETGLTCSNGFDVENSSGDGCLSLGVDSLMNASDIPTGSGFVNVIDPVELEAVRCGEKPKSFGGLLGGKQKLNALSSWFTKCAALEV